METSRSKTFRSSECLHSLTRPLRQAFRWVGYRTWNKHHVIKINSLAPGWTDMDEVLIHAMFQILCNFIEEEKPATVIDWTSDESTAKAWVEIQALYHWWKNERPKRVDPITDDSVPRPEISRGHFDAQKDAYVVRDFGSLFKDPEYKRLWKQKSDESSAWEKCCHEEDTAMMRRLIDIRDFLWT